MQSRVNELVIQTPEGVRFSFQLASPVIRFMAWLMDLFCILVLMKTVGIATQFIQLLGPEAVQVFQIITGFLISMGYGMTLEWFWKGQTLGKRIFHLRVMDEEGLRLKFSQIAMRNLLRLFDMLPGLYAVGGISTVISRKSQRLGDIAAGTLVVRNPGVPIPNLDQVLPAKFNSLRSYPHLAARLRQRISPEEGMLGFQALLRRDEMHDDPRVDLFNEIAAFYKKKVPFPTEASLGLSAEQYVRNVVDILFRVEKKGKLKG